MNTAVAKNPESKDVDVDALLQDSYLLVVELRQGGSVRSSSELSRLCIRQVEYVRLQLEQAGLNQRSIDHIVHAQCALLDETVLRYAKGDVHSGWAGNPLQARFFSRHQAGKYLYEDMREVLRDPSPDVRVLTVFQRVLVLGFQGLYREEGDPERVQLLDALSARVKPVQLSRPLSTVVRPENQLTVATWLLHPAAHALIVALLLTGAWLAFDHLLAEMITTLLPGQA